MKYHKKYQRGKIIESVAELESEISQDRYIMFNHKPMHPGFIISMPLRVIINAIKSQVLARAESAES